MWMLLAVALVASEAAACDKGCVDYEGTCACDAPAEKAPSIQAVSDEKPPEEKMPSYQRDGVHADMPPSTAAQDALSDEQKSQASSEGKKAAGL